jgi:hypothetical protein
MLPVERVIKIVLAFVMWAGGAISSFQTISKTQSSSHTRTTGLTKVRSDVASEWCFKGSEPIRCCAAIAFAHRSQDAYVCGASPADDKFGFQNIAREGYTAACQHVEVDEGSLERSRPRVGGIRRWSFVALWHFLAFGCINLVWETEGMTRQGKSSRVGHNLDRIN